MLNRISIIGCFLIFSSFVNAVDIQISQLTDNPDPATRGGEITYSVSILNNANDTASGVVLTMPMPDKTTFVSVNDANCSLIVGAPDSVVCNFGDMTGNGISGPVTMVDVVLTTDGDAPAVISFTATGTTGSVDSNAVNDSLSQNTTINAGADLLTTVSDSTDPVIAGSSLSYTITTQNIGPKDASTVTVVNTLPNDISFASASGTGWSCNAVAQVVTCTRTLIPSGTSAPNISITGQVSGAISGTITNLATVSAATGDPEPNNNTTTENTQVNVGADLQITKTTSSPVIANGTVIFSLAPRNNGPFAADTVIVSDTLPANIAYDNGDPAVGNGWVCNHSGEALGGTVTCTTATYSVGATDDITITATAPASGNFTNTATISAAIADPIAGNNSDSSASSVVPDGANLQLTKTKTPNPVAQGSNTTSVIVVTNLGPQDTSGVLTVVDTLDPGEIFSSFSGSNWVCNHLVGVVTCTYSAVPLAATASASNLSIVSVANDAGNLTNTATVSDVGGQPDNVAGNETDSATVVSTPPGNIADLQITKSISTLNANTRLENTENTLTYTLTLLNAGDSLTASVADAVLINDVIPNYVNNVNGAAPAITGVGISDDSGGKFTCSTGSIVNCRLNNGSTLSNAEEVVFTLTVDRPLADGAFTNTATVSSAQYGDDDPTNNSANAAGSIDAIADVQIDSVSASPNPVTAGTEVTYVVTYSNNGPSSAAGVEVINTFTPPVGRTYTLISSNTTKGSCGALISDVITCPIGSLNRDETETLTLVVRPDWNVDGTDWILAESVVISTTTTESSAANNTDSTNLTVNSAALDLLVNKTDLTDPLGYTPTPGAFPGSLDNIIIYKIDVTNSGPSLATSVILQDDMTPKTGKTLTFLCDDVGSASCAVGTSLCNNTNTAVVGPATQTLTCNLPDLVANTTTSRYFFFEVNTSPDSTGDTHNNLATISSSETDTQVLNNTESETTSVRARVDLAVTKDPSIATVDLNQPFDWDIVVSNNGPGDSAISDLTDSLPAGSELTAVPVPAQGSCTGVAGDTSFTCSLGTINNGASVTITVPVRVTVFPAAGTLTNTATVSSFGVDDIPVNDSDDGTVTVRRSSISGNVFNDINDDGDQDVGDSDISGVSVDLDGTDNYGNVINLNTVTDVNGFYEFTGLSASDVTGYTLTETQPAGFNDGLESIGGVIITGSRSTDVIGNITVGINATLTDYDFADLGQAGISGLVWADENNNATVDANETTRISGVQINLTGTETASGLAINDNTVTAANGTYNFMDLRAGTYSVSEVQPVAWADGQESLGSFGGIVGADLFSNIVLVTNSDSALNYNFGELGASLSGVVYKDNNLNGTDDAEPKIAEVTVILSGRDVNGNNVSLSTLTNNLGAYLFENIPASSGAGYRITETQPVDYTDGADALGSLGGDGSMSDVFSAIVLAAGGSGTFYNFGEGVLLRSSIAGSVYQDSNNDGSKDLLEQGIENVELSLSGKTSDGYQINQTLQTSADGSYLFEKLGPSDADGYQISEVQPNNYDDGLENASGIIVVNSRTLDLLTNIALGSEEDLTGYLFGELPQGKISGSVYLDADDNGSIAATEQKLEDVELTLSGNDVNGVAISLTVNTDVDGYYVFANLPQSDVTGYQISESQPANYNDGLESVDGILVVDSRATDMINNIMLSVNQELNNYNFAELYSSGVSGSVFVDANNDGLRAIDDLGIEGVSIQLIGNDEHNNSVSLSTTTDVDGMYRFNNLAPSNNSGYLIVEQHPDLYLDGLESIDGVLIIQSDQTDVIQLPALLIDQEQANNLFAEIAGVSIQGTVWVDNNDNAQIDEDENIRIAGVTIELTGSDFLGNAVNLSLLTDNEGNYEFSRVLKGTYIITEQQPAAWLDGKDQLGSLGGVQANDQFSNVIVINVDSGANYNFGERGSSIAGLVYNDLDDDGVVDSNEAGIPEVIIRINATDIDGQPVTRQTFTRIDGTYQFNHLPIPSGDGYTITETQPEDTSDGKDSIGSLGGTLGNDVISQIGFADHLVAGADYNFGEKLLDPASISGFVWLDSNHNRNDDEGNGQIDWIVELIEHDDDPLAQIKFTPIATVTTNSDGYYIFEGLSAGLYEVRFRHPEGGVLYGTPISSHAGTDTDRGTIRNLILKKSEDIIEQNLPIDPMGVVYNSQTREPVAGATVTIVGPLGFNVAEHLLGGEANQTQITGNDGLYQFLLFNTAPAGSYRLEIIEASGYLPGVAPSIPACTNSLIVGIAATPALVHLSDNPPIINSAFHVPEDCPANISELDASNNSTQYYLSFEISPTLPSANVLNNHIPLDPYSDELISVTKTSTETTVSRGDFVPYQINITNNNGFAIAGLSIIDQLPPGFKYLIASAKVDGVTFEPVIVGKTLTWNDININAGQSLLIDLITIIGAGVGEGLYTNQAWIVEASLGIPLSNKGLASIRVVPDPILDCSDLTGKVFDDANVNGYPDENESGLPGIRLATARGLLITTDEYGRYHIACAAIPDEMRGSNFIMKVDERTLPSGYRITTENPRVTRLTRGKLTKINFGATIHKVIRVEVNNDAFNGHELTREFRQRLVKLIAIVKLRPSVIRIAYQRQKEGNSLVEQRVAHMKGLLETVWSDCDCNYPLTIEEENFRIEQTDAVPPLRGIKQ
jgi:uncharacterized repeat protein (TIGR01451 family)